MENQFISYKWQKEAKKDAKRIILNSNCENIKAGSKYPCNWKHLIVVIVAVMNVGVFIALVVTLAIIVKKTNNFYIQ